jgi:mono/diheme cytochrome c family protein
MTIALWILVVTVLSLIFLTRRWRRFARVMRLVTLYPLLFLLCFVIVARWQLHSTVSSDAATAQHGKKLFENNCQGCHSLGQGRRIGPDLKYVADRYDGDVLSLWMMNSDAVYQEFGRRPLTQSYPPMPKLDLEKKDADAISAYLMSISAGDGLEADGAE